MSSVALCYHTSGSSSLVPAELQRHVYKRHIYCKDKLIAFLKRKCDGLKSSENDLTTVIKNENINVCVKHRTKWAYHSSQCGEARWTLDNLRGRQFRVWFLIITWTLSWNFRFQILEFLEESRTLIVTWNANLIKWLKIVTILLCRLISPLTLTLFRICLHFLDTYMTISLKIR
jgi:hypothetical protein